MRTARADQPSDSPAVQPEQPKKEQKRGFFGKIRDIFR
jgi:hypothetical protein